MNSSKVIEFIDNGFDSKKFPERFSNQVYLSEVIKFDSFTYQTPVSIKFTSEGEELFIVNNTTRLVRKNQFLIVNDGDIIEVGKAKNAGVSKALSIFIDPKIISDVHSDLLCKVDTIPEGVISSKGEIEFYSNVVSDDTFLLSTLKNLMKYGSLVNSLGDLFYYQISEQLLTFQFRFERKLQSINKVKRTTQLEIYKRVNIAREYLEENYIQNFDLDKLARASCMSRYFLIKCFKEIYGLTPQKFHSQKRIEKAAHLLAGGYSVGETALLLGYPNIQYFSRQFKNAIGYSPKHCQV